MCRRKTEPKIVGKMLGKMVGKMVGKMLSKSRFKSQHKTESKMRRNHDRTGRDWDGHRQQDKPNTYFGAGK